MVGHVSRPASVEEGNAVGTRDQHGHRVSSIRGERSADRAARTVAADRRGWKIGTMPGRGVIRFVIMVLLAMRDLRAAVLARAKIGGDRRVAAQRQRGDDQLYDQDFANASHAGNPITAKLLFDRSRQARVP